MIAVRVGLTQRALDALPALTGLTASETATRLRALVAPLAVRRAILATLHQGDARRDVQRAIASVWGTAFGSDYGDAGDVDPASVCVEWAAYAHGGVGPYAAYDLDPSGRPPESAWTQRDSTASGLGKVCAYCKDPATIADNKADLVRIYGLRPRRYVARDGVGTVYIARQSYCKACRTTAGPAGTIADRRQVREARVGSADATDLIDAVTARAERVTKRSRAKTIAQ